MEPNTIREVAFDAYQYAYPLVIMDLTRQQATNVPDAHSVPLRAPVNQFAHGRSTPAGDSRDVVRFNFDTLYSFAWLDLRDEPVVVSVPESAERYYLTPMLDMWSDVFAVPGTRTTGGSACDLLIAAPGWAGTPPEGVDVVMAPTPNVWVMGRTQANGPADHPNVHAIQDQYRITPFSAWGQPYEPPTGLPVDASIDDSTAPFDQINALTGVEILTRLAALLRTHPPHANDYPILSRLRSIGIEVGRPFAAEDLDTDTRAIIDAAAAEALADMVSATTDGSLGKTIDSHWIWIEGGTYGTDYRLRAMVAMAGLGCNLREDALYPGLAVDADGELLNGEHRYVLRFEADQLPPVDAFWSLTMYDEEGFQIPNPIDRFAIGDRDPLRFEDDGALELIIQHDPPGTAQDHNWLPASSGNFQLTLRMYSPRPDVLRHGLHLPPVRKIR